MVIREFARYSKQYFALVIAEAILLSLYLVSSSSNVRLLLAILTGSVYVFWGLFSHRGQPRTDRLVLEYAAVGFLAFLMLASLVYTT